jgi:penicillin-binding protein 1A
MTKISFKIIAKIIIFLTILLVLTLGAIATYYCIGMPSLNDLENQNSKQIVRLNYDNQNLIINRSEIYQSEVSYYELPTNLVNAVIATEDRKFFSHGGIDYLAIIRAYFVNKQAGKIVQGGSTITQQLAKLLFLKPEKTFRRKVQEALLALQLEKNFSKEQILTFYLNRAYFGSNNYGIGNASKQYFNKEVAQLNIQESALLAGLLKAPSKISPKNNPELAKRRTRTVLKAMQECGYLDKNFANDDEKEDFFREDFGQRFYFADYAYQQIFEFINKENFQDKILKITTTLNEKLQNNLEEILNKFTKNNAEKLLNAQIAVVVMDKSGAVLALSGGNNYQQSQFNRAILAKRQAGSAFKTFLYLSAFQNGYKIDDVFEDKRVRVSNWLPDNYESRFLGEITLKRAFANSSNSVAVQLSKLVGAKKIAQTARLSGITSKIDEHDLTISLGTSQVSLFELTSAYATIANDGTPVIPYVISQISNQNDEILYQKTNAKLPKVFSASAIEAIKIALREVVESGTGKIANVNSEIYGKTGTSQNFRDAWFVGFDDEKIVGIWIGNDDNLPTQKITGGSLPAELFSKIMQN